MMYSFADKQARGLWGRVVKCALLGAAGGFLLLAAALGPSMISYAGLRARQAYDQESLVTAAAKSSAFDRLARLTVYVETDGGETTVSPDGEFWYVPRDGVVELELPAGEYELCALTDNRWVKTRALLTPGEENHVVLDTTGAPKIAEYTVLRAEEGGLTFHLPVEGADRVFLTPDAGMEGVSVSLAGGQCVITLAEDMPGGGYIPLCLMAENDLGTAQGFVGIEFDGYAAPVAISSAEGLALMRENPAGHYVLTADLDLTDMTPWIPIGTESTPFSGRLDGQGHEIRGLTLDVNGDIRFTAFLGYLRGAVVENLIFRQPSARGGTPVEGSIAVLACSVKDSLIRNCGVFGGAVDANTRCNGLIGGAFNSHMINLFNSADVYSARSFLPNTGGICGYSQHSYLLRCANEGDILGHHLTGGISGAIDYGIMRSCVNSGQVRGVILGAAYLPGGITQASQQGIVAGCCFVRGQSPCGVGWGRIHAVHAVEWAELRAPQALACLGSFEGENPQWRFASLDAAGPVPAGIFAARASLPDIEVEGGRVVIPPSAATYFYTLDGSDPWIYGLKASNIDLTLKAGQSLRVYAARQGFYDSAETVMEGGR